MEKRGLVIATVLILGAAMFSGMLTETNIIGAYNQPLVGQTERSHQLVSTPIIFN